MIIAIEYFWKDDQEKEINVGFAKISEEVCEDDDDLIFYYANSIDEVERLKEVNNNQDFVLIRYKEII
jgi:hypothetical protein